MWSRSGTPGNTLQARWGAEDLKMALWLAETLGRTLGIAPVDSNGQRGGNGCWR
jgi:hypothetical protein